MPYTDRHGRPEIVIHHDIARDAISTVTKRPTGKLHPAPPTAPPPDSLRSGLPGSRGSSPGR